MIKTEDKLFKDVQAYVSKFIDTKVYSREQWEKKESTMFFGEVIFVAEGELSYALNGQHGLKEKAAIKKIAEKHGCYIEQGFLWSWHFIKKETIDS